MNHLKTIGGYIIEFWHSRFNNFNKLLKITADVSECVLSDTGIHG